MGILATTALATQLTACISPKSYVDPQFHKTGYNDIARTSQAIPVKVDVNFQRNGKDLPRANSELKSSIERSLRASGVFAPTDTVNSPSILVNGNNIADLAAARAKGFGTGLTFGAAGSTIDDNYEFSFKYNDAQGVAHNAIYKHTIHTSIGNTKAPEGLKPTTIADAFNKVVEDVVLNFVKKLQDDGVIPNK